MTINFFNMHISIFLALSPLNVVHPETLSINPFQHYFINGFFFVFKIFTTKHFAQMDSAFNVLLTDA